MEYAYKPYMERSFDRQYTKLLSDIKNSGRRKKPIHASLSENQNSGHDSCLELTGKCLEFYLANGFPLITCRDLGKSFFGAIGEIIAFLNGARTMTQLMQFGCPKVFWESWTTKEKCEIFGLVEGDIGPGSYGASLANFTTDFFGSPSFNQVDALINNMRRRPELRTHCLTTWNPPLSMGDIDQKMPRKVTVAPCHGNFVTFTLFPESEEIEMTTTCRSSDAPVGLPLNIVEWTALGLMVAYLMNYKLTKSTFFLANPQIYDIQIPAVNELLLRSPIRFPTVIIKPNPHRKIERLQDFRKEDFVLESYHPHPKLHIRTAI